MKMTNSDIYESLSEADKKSFTETYSQHPLADYIDWKAFYESDDGDEMHFLKYERTEKNENGSLVYVLKEIDDNGEDYEIIYDTDEQEVQKRPIER